ncbi:terminase large subunit [Hydrocarboniphaga effusa]|uniref:terminase large subunit n=1 Tax=Hydrocarboniphaga effusa TaxID=243629 RepID=UPI00398BFA96
MNRDTACLDWADRLKNGKSIIPPPLYPEQAQEALKVFRELRIVDAPGSPTFGEACAPWVFDLVASIFGAYNADTGRREITEWFVCLPKKNSKSTIAAGIMMTALILNWRQSAEFAVIAPTIEVAGNAYSPARDMAGKDEDLDALMHVQNHVRTITHRESGATLKVIAADSDTVGGKKSVGTLVDELHLFGSRANAEGMFREAIGGLASRPEGFVIWLTTQSDEPPAGVFKQKLQYARQVRDGVIKDDRFVPVIYEFPEAMLEAGEHLKPDNFGVVNPNLNYSVDREFLERELRKAQDAGEESLRGFLAKHLNVEIGLALKSNNWAGATFWEAQGDGITLKDLIARCDVITAGIDGGGLDDMLALSFIGREEETGDWLHWAHAWIHPIVLERRKQEAARFRDFEKQGSLTIVQHVGEDLAQLAQYVKQVEQAELLDRVGLDPVGIGAVIDALQDREEGPGLESDRLLAVPQGWKLVGAIKTTERKLAEGSLRHEGKPMMAWCVGNAKVVPSGNAVLITKQASGSAKIDPLMATFNATSLMSMNPKPRKKRFQMMIF